MREARHARKFVKPEMFRTPGNWSYTKVVHEFDGSVRRVESYARTSSEPGGRSVIASYAPYRETGAASGPRVSGEVHKNAGLIEGVRRLRRKAMRLGLWPTALRDTERALLSASMRLKEIGGRIQAVVREIALKLERAVKSGFFARMEQVGAGLARSTSEFFWGKADCSAKTRQVLADLWLLRYLGVSLSFSQNMGALAP